MNFLTRNKNIANPRRKTAVGFLFRKPRLGKLANSSAKTNARHPDYLSGAGYLLTKSAAECIHQEGMKEVIHWIRTEWIVDKS